MTKKTARYTAAALVIILGILAIAPGSAALAQESTPTPTPEPVTGQVITFDNGNLLLNHEITLGDIAIVIVGLFIAAILYVKTVVQVVTDKLK